jgi:phage-related tail protein
MKLIKKINKRINKNSTSKNDIKKIQLKKSNKKNKGQVCELGYLACQKQKSIKKISKNIKKRSHICCLMCINL